MSLPASDDALHARLFPSEQAPAVAQLIVANADEEDGILREWGS